MPSETPIEEALRLANRDKESILKRIEAEIRSAEALPNTGEINTLLRAGRLGALHLLKETFTRAGWIESRGPAKCSDCDDGCRYPGAAASRTLIQKIEAEARRYAEMYQPSSDGQNTFVIFADWVATLSRS
jgi:hypothetical protein